MANWNLPTLSSLYTDFLTEVKNRDLDATTMFLNAPSNQPVGAIKLERTAYKFQEWSGAVWTDRPIGVAGGGTGAGDAANARTNLGLGTIATQNANAVAITGGTISGITALSVSGSIAFGADNTYDIGTAAVMVRRLYVKGGALAPVGVDKWIPA